MRMLTNVFPHTPSARERASESGLSAQPSSSSVALLRVPSSISPSHTQCPETPASTAHTTRARSLRSRSWPTTRARAIATFFTFVILQMQYTIHMICKAGTPFVIHMSSPTHRTSRSQTPQSRTVAACVVRMTFELCMVWKCWLQSNLTPLIHQLGWWHCLALFGAVHGGVTGGAGVDVPARGFVCESESESESFS